MLYRYYYWSVLQELHTNSSVSWKVGKFSFHYFPHIFSKIMHENCVCFKHTLIRNCVLTKPSINCKQCSLRRIFCWKDARNHVKRAIWSICTSIEWIYFDHLFTCANNRCNSIGYECSFLEKCSKLCAQRIGQLRLLSAPERSACIRCSNTFNEWIMSIYVHMHTNWDVGMWFSGEFQENASVM